MEKVLDTGDNLLTLVKLTDAITAGSLIKRQNKMPRYSQTQTVKLLSSSSPHERRHRRKPTD
jgi:hypothetical protein